MANIIPYLTCDSALETLEHYEMLFGDDILISRVPVNKEMAKNMNLEVDLSKTTLHMNISLDGELIMASDNFSGDEIYPQNILLEYNSDNEKELARLKEIAKNFEDNEDCQTLMPLADQFWGGMMGHYKDKYGNLFMLHAQSFDDRIKAGGALGEYYSKKK